MAVNDDILDAMLRHEVGLRRYSTATLYKVIALLNRIDARLTAEILKRDPGSGPFTDRRLQLLLDAIHTLMTEAYNNVTGTFDDEAKALALYEAQYQGDMFSRLVPIKLDIVTPGSAQLYAAVHARPFQGRLLRDWYKELSAGAFKRLRDAIRMGFVEGRTTDQIVRDIRGTRANKFRDGILETNRRGVEAMVRTALNHTATVARGEVYKQNSSVIKGVKWVSTLDGRTSAVCRARDGQVYDVDKGPRPPAHINCRSTTVPILKSWRDLGINKDEIPIGTRASMNGQVPGELTYQDWLKRQPQAFQDEVLGSTKAKLFRDGKLPLDRFVDRSGHEYTLDELRRREAEAWKMAGL